MNNDRHVMLAGDDGVLYYIRACIRSLAVEAGENTSWYTVHVVYDGVDLVSAKSFLTGLGVRVEMYMFDRTLVKNLPPTASYINHPVSYARLFPSLFGLGDISRAVYLDADTLVVDNIDMLWLMPFGKRCLAMGEFYDKYNWFNAGMLVYALDKWRTLGLETKCAVFVTVIGDDEQILNKVCGTSIRVVSKRFNFPVHEDLFATDCAVVHFFSQTKPDRTWSTFVPYWYACAYAPTWLPNGLLRMVKWCCRAAVRVYKQLLRVKDEVN